MIRKIKDYASEHKKGLTVAGVIITLGIIYFILLQFTSFRLKCPFQMITGLACPGCGITTLINRLAHFEFISAISENYAVSILAPFSLIIYAVRIIFKPRCLQNNGKLFNIIVWTTLFVLILFGIVRNLPGMEFLLPTYMR